MLKVVSIYLIQKRFIYLAFNTVGLNIVRGEGYYRNITETLVSIVQGKIMLS